MSPTLTKYCIFELLLLILVSYSILQSKKYLKNPLIYCVLSPPVVILGNFSVSFRRLSEILSLKGVKVKNKSIISHKSWKTFKFNCRWRNSKYVRRSSLKICSSKKRSLEEEGLGIVVVDLNRPRRRQMKFGCGWRSKRQRHGTGTDLGSRQLVHKRLPLLSLASFFVNENSPFTCAALRLGVCNICRQWYAVMPHGKVRLHAGHRMQKEDSPVLSSGHIRALR